MKSIDALREDEIQALIVLVELAPGGRMGILCGEDLTEPLHALGFSYRETVLDREPFAHMKRKRAVAAALEPLFARESIELVWKNLMTESVPPEAVFGADPRTSFRRLYLVRVE